jgi:hypothetical protein
MKKLLDSFLDEQADFVKLLEKHNINYALWPDDRYIIWLGKIKPPYPHSAIALGHYFADITFSKSKVKKIKMKFDSFPDEAKGFSEEIKDWLYDKYLGY